AKDIEKAANKVISRELKAHYRIIFNEDGYGPDWEHEAERRGLLNHKTTADAVPVCFEEENISVFVRQGVYTKGEAIARADIQLENYVKIINIEARTMLEMARRDIVPAVSDYVAALCSNVAAKQAVNEELPCTGEKQTITTLATLNDEVYSLCGKLEGELKKINLSDVRTASQSMAHTVIPVMDEIRARVDKMETLTAADYWPYPTYFDLLYSVNN
ncbi:MAG: glutamine synthetase type III, partial [Clostridia bacterium]|nr:glutamine synthetase type III [Clostridia bacterium]